MVETMESAITAKGQATIPKPIRDHLQLKPGDRVKFFVHPDGSVVLLPKIPASALRGIVKPRRHRPVTIEEIAAAAAAGAAGPLGVFATEFGKIAAPGQTLSSLAPPGVPIIAKTSRRLNGSSRKAPSMRLVTIVTPGL